jgi:uncharacterized membrane protein YedE/YeeE
MESFDMFFPVGMSHYIVGGLFIGFGVSFLYVVTGLVGGMSSLYSAVWSYCSNIAFFQKDSHVKSRQWRLVYAAGLIVGAVIWQSMPGSQSVMTGISTWQLLLGGFIAGFGARYGNGCTSGHGICGMAAFSVPSILAVITFLAAGMVTAQLMASLG